MRKFELITGKGEDDFKKSLHEWNENNKKATVLGISHSSIEISNSFSANPGVKEYKFSAIIWYTVPEELTEGDSPIFGWDDKDE